MIESLVSTIIPVYNRSSMLLDAVNSVLSQSYNLIEIIIVNDGSTDNTTEIADELAANYPDVIRVIHKENSGPGLSREAGRRIARGEFIQYLDSDDILLPCKFETQVKGLLKNPDCDIAYGKTLYYKIGEYPSELKPWKRTGEKIEFMFPSFLISRWWGTSTPLYRKRLLDSAGPWTELKNEEDWEYDCRLASLGAKLLFCDKFVSEERDHSDDRLSRGGTTEKDKLKDRAISHYMIYQHAANAGIDQYTTEMRHFARELFLISRQCGAAGLPKESREMFELSKKASGDVRGRGWDFRLYQSFASILGWSMAGKISCYSDRFRS